MDLTKLRDKIDAIDAKVVELLNERAEASLAIGAEKRKNQKSIYAPDREKQVLKRIKSLNKGPMKDGAFEAIYREIMSSSLSLEKSLKIAYLGPEASYTQMAAMKRFGSQLDYVPCASIADVFQMVEKHECDYGVVPIENSIEGAVTHTIDLLVDSDLKICSQILLDIKHNLMANCAASRIKKIYSNPQVFGQCRTWLQKNFPNAELISTSSTTKAAQMAAKEKNAASISSELAAQVYNLNIIQKGIQDSTHNITRFLVLSPSTVPATGKDRTSVVFAINDKVGALLSVLDPFHKHKINMTKIESRPIKRKAWEYYFFVDLEGHVDNPNVAEALQQLSGMCQFVKVLGSYPVLE